MLAHTHNPRRGEQGLPLSEDPQQEAEDEGRPSKHHLEGSEDAGRALTLDFSAAVDALKAIPDPDPDAEARYEPGLDLLGALVAESEDFGTAAPGVGPHAALAEQVLALTDEAFEKADTVLESLAEGGLPPADEGGASTAQLYMLMARLRTISITDERRRMLRLPPAPDPHVGSEFY